MQLFSSFLKLAHSVVIISMFGGMLAVAGLTIFALSPVSYEDYQAWKAKAQENVALREEGEVAGVFSDSQPISATNLLSSKDKKYTSAFLGEAYLLYFETEQVESLPLLRLGNQLDVSESDYLVCLSPQANVTGSYGITVNLMSQLQELEVNAPGADANCEQNYRLKLYGSEKLELRFTGAGKFRVKLSKLPTSELASLP